ncbi:MAG: 4Fe-4S dicluster domain-containing protein [Thermodesulfobacteriota bacterium]
MPKKIFVIDVKKCNGCHVCQVACKDEHVANDWTPIAKPQPETGHFWLKLEQTVRGTVPKVKVAYRPHLCMHCDQAPCMEACPVEEAIYKRGDGLIIIDPVKCTGCRNCVDACPYNTIFFNEGLNIAQKCTGCAHLLDEGWTEPRCADACPTLAIRMVEETKARKLVSQGDVWKPELKNKVRPRVHYLHLPGRFIAGTVYDPTEKEVIIGATCTLTEAGSGRKSETQTDSYGDFWFEDLKEGKFDLQIRMAGKVESFRGLDTTGMDINLGDIPLV